MTASDGMARRVFLARIGLLGAAAGIGGLVPSTALATTKAPFNGPVEDLVRLLRPVLDALALDTMNGLAVFACPGPDLYSRVQGTVRREPGGIEAKTPQFLTEALNSYLPLPDQLLRPVTAALATGLADANVKLPGMEKLPGAVGTLDKALSWLVRNDASLPLPAVVAALLNLVATSVSPRSVAGPFTSPFARLSYAQKAQVFARIEAPLPDLVATLDVKLPQPLKEALSGLLRSLGGALPVLASYGSYCEHGVFNRKTRQLTGRPVGWRLTGYQPQGPGEGHKDFIGYYQGRKEVHD